MKFLRKLRTSDRISTIFVLFNFFALLILLASINVVYFFIWYEDQRQMSHYDMAVNYHNLVDTNSFSNIEAFREYIMDKDTIILSGSGELSCSQGVSEKIHSDKDALEDLNDSWFFKDGNKIYFIFSQYYNDIGEVKVLFDTTEYIKSQIIIIKISLIIIAIFGVLSYFIGKGFSKYALQDLRKIAQQAQEMSIDNFHEITVDGPKCDEMRILADTINTSFKKIQCQAGNLKQFITDVSHEFKTPLMVINSQIDLYNKKVEKNRCSPTEVENLLVSIKKNTKKLNKLLETLFLLSRKSEGIEKFDREEVDISLYIKNYSRDLVSSMNSQIELTFQCEAGIKKYVETSTLNIVLENLLTNAIKFNKKIPHIEVGLDRDHFWIKDSGPGIGEEDLDKIWTKFYRKDVNIEGFGIGLFIVKRILDLYNWKAEVVSELGVGTTFKIYF